MTVTAPVHVETIDGWPVEYTDTGETDKQPILLLSGWAQDHRLFRHVAPLLTERFRVLAVNYRGHDAGLTRGDFTAADLAGDVVTLVERLGLRDVALLSTSHGCWINIDVHERLGDASLGRTAVIDWLMAPFEGFHRQIREGMAEETHVAARQSLFDEWTEGTDCLDVVDHVNREMTWFGGEMWMRACREIDAAYAAWGDPLKRMSELAHRLRVTHIYSQPLAEDYRLFQERFAAENPWFSPHHIPGRTHFPTLESPGAVADAVLRFYA